VETEGVAMMFSNLNGKELALVEKTGVLKAFTLNTPIIREGDTGNSFYLIISGRVEVRKNLKRGKFQKLVEMGPAEMFGEICFLGEEKRSASVVAVEDCHVLEFRKDALDHLMKLNPEIGMKIYAGMAKELAHRLALSDEALRDAIVWSMGTKPGTRSGT
jgi:CRP/FNR family cyclic AMP-dependent transcriptional regulator